MGFWGVIAKVLVKGAVWAVDHPDTVIQIVQQVKDEKKPVPKP